VSNDFTDEEFLAELGRRLAARRAELRLSQSQVAERIGLSSIDMISRYERGATDLRLSTLIRLARALECAPYALLPRTLRAPRQRNPDAGAYEPALLEAFRSVPPDRLELAVRLVGACAEEFE
jgi:transcriptional regulator with XRE-family HTH domain